MRVGVTESLLRQYMHHLTLRSGVNRKRQKPDLWPPQPGCWIVAPLLPHAKQRTYCRSLSLDASAPQRMTAAAQVNGALCWHRSQCIQSQGVELADRRASDPDQAATFSGFATASTRGRATSSWRRVRWAPMNRNPVAMEKCARLGYEDLSNDVHKPVPDLYEGT